MNLRRCLSSRGETSLAVMAQGHSVQSPKGSGQHREPIGNSKFCSVDCALLSNLTHRREALYISGDANRHAASAWFALRKYFLPLLVWVTQTRIDVRSCLTCLYSNANCLLIGTLSDRQSPEFRKATNKDSATISDDIAGKATNLASLIANILFLNVTFFNSSCIALCLLRTFMHHFAAVFYRVISMFGLN